MMDLKRALRAGRETCLALVGAGGKTTALFLLARQLSPPVLVSASTHLAKSQLCLADRHWIITEAGQISNLIPDILQNGVTLFTGPQSEPVRTGGLSEEILTELQRLAIAHHLPLLIEADGSRRKSLKAPAAHEPPIPSWVNMVCVVAGLSGLGKPLDDEHVHRAGQFAELTHSRLNDPVTPSLLADYLLHPLGGLKNIPLGARKVALLNQADTPDLRETARTISEQLLESYDAVLIASLGLEGSPVYAAQEPVAGIILAAGGSQRFGQAKVLLDLHGKPLVRHVVETALQSGLSPVVVVAGMLGDEIQAAVGDLPISVIRNSEWAAGQSTSLRAGLKELRANCGAAFFLLADQPQIPASIVRSLKELHDQSLAPVIAPRVNGKRANPVIFDRKVFPDLLALEGDTGGRAVLSRYPVTWLDSDDPRLLFDVDTPEDYRQLLEMEIEEK